MRKSITKKPDEQTTLPAITFAAAPNKILQGDQAVYAAFQAIDWLQFPDVDEVLVKAGLNRANLRTLEADDEVSQCIETRRDALISTPWRLEPQQSRASQWLSEQLAPSFYNFQVLPIHVDDALIHRPERRLIHHGLRSLAG